MEASAQPNLCVFRTSGILGAKQELHEDLGCDRALLESEGGGRHASLRSNPQPRILALQEQLLCLLRMANNQGAIDIGAMAVSNANQGHTPCI